MADDSGFMNAILANPEDEAVRLIYADWLEEADDPRAEYLRIHSELARLKGKSKKKLRLQERLERLRSTLPSGWVAVIENLGVPFHAHHFDTPPADLPFTERIGMRGKLVTFESQFRGEGRYDEGLERDVQFLSTMYVDSCSYGAADPPVHPFICYLASDTGVLTGVKILEGLKARDFRSQHIRNLKASRIAFPGYHPHTENDEIHTDFMEQYIFNHDVWDESQATYGLKDYVDNGQLWYVLLHPTRHNGLCGWVILFGVGRSPHGKRLVGVVTHQVCHNLCD
jgi:uncharacterized protein (TIGR02996 family)